MKPLRCGSLESLYTSLPIPHFASFSNFLFADDRNVESLGRASVWSIWDHTSLFYQQHTHSRNYVVQTVTASPKPAALCPICWCHLVSRAVFVTVSKTYMDFFKCRLHSQKGHPSQAVSWVQAGCAVCDSLLGLPVPSQDKLMQQLSWQ